MKRQQRDEFGMLEVIVVSDKEGLLEVTNIPSEVKDCLDL